MPLETPKKLMGLGSTTFLELLSPPTVLPCMFIWRYTSHLAPWPKRGSMVAFVAAPAGARDLLHKRLFWLSHTAFGQGHGQLGWRPTLASKEAPSQDPYSLGVQPQRQGAADQGPCIPSAWMASRAALWRKVRSNGGCGWRIARTGAQLHPQRHHEDVATACSRNVADGMLQSE